MSDIYVKAPQQSVKQESNTPHPKKTGPQPASQTPDSDVPFTMYESENSKPFTAEYYGLGDMWSEDVYTEELSTIEGFFKEKAEQGKIDNSTKAVKELLKRYEHQANIESTDRTVVKLAKLSAYLKFLKETEHIDTQSSKYAR